MVSGVNSTARHLQFARGYTDLGMINEARNELEGINWEDRMRPEVMVVHVDLYLAGKN